LKLKKGSLHYFCGRLPIGFSAPLSRRGYKGGGLGQKWGLTNRGSHWNPTCKPSNLRTFPPSTFLPSHLQTCLSPATLPPLVAPVKTCRKTCWGDWSLSEQERRNMTEILICSKRNEESDGRGKRWTVDGHVTSRHVKCSAYVITKRFAPRDWGVCFDS